ncbi:MAG TPA: winged helix-turn-helix domain-containing protein [Nitrososphaeraceae archaeon]|nr:winged helix-turn-helix domain-containing protein [Nitrososphaeraceae archaeon]
MSGSPSSYRDRIYIVKDVILKLVEYGELNQTALVSFCGLNLKKHKSILEDIEDNDLIEKREVTLGKRIVTMYRPTQKGMAFCRDILEPYEKMFPRRKEEEEKKKKEESSIEGNEKKNFNKGSLMLVLI